MPMSKDIGYIYKITSPAGYVYIGKTINLRNRYNDHKRKNIKSNSFINKSLLKYGFDNHKFEILDEVALSSLSNAERFYISICKSYNGINPMGMNLTVGGDGTSGYKHSEEYKERIREIVKESYRNGFVTANKGIACSEEQKKQISETLKRKYASGEIICPSTGKKRTAKNKKKISDAKKGCVGAFSGKKHSEESRLKISIALKGKGHIQSEKTKRKLRKLNTGKKLSEETKLKISITKKIQFKNKKLCTETI